MIHNANENWNNKSTTCQKLWYNAKTTFGEKYIVLNEYNRKEERFNFTKLRIQIKELREKMK